MNVDAWLKFIGMEEYADVFAENAVEFSLLPGLTEDDLEKLGVVKLGHRKKMLSAMAELGGRGPESTSHTEAHPSTRIPSPPSRLASGPERRHLTVMFCDLVGSTILGQRLDPEDLSEVLGRYRASCEDVIRDHQGFVARIMGDGLLVYFGYPEAREDDAARAVRAALNIVAAVGALPPIEDFRLEVRVGIATGLVVVGEIVGKGAAEETAAQGHTPNLAARLQGLAQPNQIVIARTTRELIGGQFAIEDLGAHKLKGIEQPTQAFRAVAENAGYDRFSSRGPTSAPLVSRKPELGLLKERWLQAAEGNGQVVLIGGEAGIGKSRLLQEFQKEIEGEPHSRIFYHGGPHHQNSAFYPVANQLERAIKVVPGDRPHEKLSKLTATLDSLSLSSCEIRTALADLLDVSEEGDQAAEDMAPERRKALTLDAIGSLVNAMANAQPVLFIVEDAHWIDPSTLELLDLIVARVAALHILLLVTFRPDFPPRWRTEGRISTITLIRLSARETSLLVASVAGGSSLPGAVVDQIVERTDGVPLFVEELTKNLLEFCEDIDDRSRVVDAGIVIPSSLQDSLMARLDRLGAAKILAQVAAVIGRTFERDLLARVSGADESTLKQMLDRLTESGLVQRIGGVDATYQFKHALVRDCAYDSLLKKVRREHHAKIAETLEAPLERGGLPQANLIAMLAHHNFKARRWEKALKYANACGQKALARSAYRESVGYLNQALAALEHLEDSPESVQLEIDTRIMLRGAHGALGDTKAMLDEIRRADALARQIGDQHRLGLVSILLTYSLSHLGLLAEAIVAADRARKVAQSSNDRMLAACTEVAVSHAHHYSGTSRRLVESLTPVGRFLRDEAPLTRFGSPMTNSVTCFGNLAMAYADLGEFSDAVKSGDTTQEIAGLTDRPLDLAYAHLARGYAYLRKAISGTRRNAWVRDCRIVGEMTCSCMRALTPVRWCTHTR